MKRKILQRLRQPSSWLGVGLILQMLGLGPDDVTSIQNAVEAVVVAITAVSGAIAVFRSDRDDRLDVLTALPGAPAPIPTGPYDAPGFPKP